jgi:MFS family permease
MGSPDGRSVNTQEQRSVVALLVTVFTTATAAMAQDTVLGKQIYDLTGSTFALGMLGLVAFLPSAVLVLVTGAVADRVDRRRVTAVGALGEAVASGALAWYAHTDPTSALPIFGFVFLFGVARAFVGPASRALPADIVPAERLPKIVARYAVSWQVAIIAGPVMGGFLYAVNVTLPYLAVMVLLVIGAGAVGFVHTRTPQPALEPQPAPVPLPVATEAALEAAIEPGAGHGEPAAAPTARPGLHEALEGLRFVRRRPVLLGAISLDLFAVLLGGATALLPVFARDVLEVGPQGFGILRASPAVGALMVATYLAHRPIRTRAGVKMLLAVGLFGLMTVVFAFSRSVPLSVFALATLGGADMVSVFTRQSLVQIATPDRMRGRVSAVATLFIGASNELGEFESGVMARVLGPVGAVAFGGAGAAAVTVVWAWLFPRLRMADRLV